MHDMGNAALMGVPEKVREMLGNLTVPGEHLHHFRLLEVDRCNSHMKHQ